jgi:hypothetical protein
LGRCRGTLRCASCLACSLGLASRCSLTPCRRLLNPLQLLLHLGQPLPHSLGGQDASLDNRPRLLLGVRDSTSSGGSLLGCADRLRLAAGSLLWLLLLLKPKRQIDCLRSLGCKQFNISYLGERQLCFKLL